MTFNAAGLVKLESYDSDEFSDYFGFTPTCTLSAAGDKFDIKASGLGDSAELNVVKLTGTEFEFTQTFIGEWSTLDGNFTYDYSFTMTFKRP